MSDTSITIDTKPMSLIIEEGDKFIFDPRAENAIKNWVEFLAKVEEAKERVKEVIGNAMRERNILKIEGNDIKVSRRYFGERFELFDVELAKKQGFAKEVVKVSADSKAIEEYAKTTGELPEGVKLRDRNESVVIQEIGGKHAEE